MRFLNLAAGTLIVAAVSIGSFSSYHSYHLNQNVELVKKSFEIFNANDLDAEIAKYHSQDYIQHADGKTLNYEQLVAHVKYVKDQLASPLEISYDNIIAENNHVCTSHRAKATKKDGSAVEIQVIAIHSIKDGKIYQTDELSHVITGGKDDAELGSKH